eukprot:Clim_evm26s88 gene=Clim_evmTU26s88
MSSQVRKRAKISGTDVPQVNGTTTSGNAETQFSVLMRREIMQGCNILERGVGRALFDSHGDDTAMNVGRVIEIYEQAVQDYMAGREDYAREVMVELILLSLQEEDFSARGQSTIFCRSLLAALAQRGLLDVDLMVRRLLRNFELFRGPRDLDLAKFIIECLPQCSYKACWLAVDAFFKQVHKHLEGKQSENVQDFEVLNLVANMLDHILDPFNPLIPPYFLHSELRKIVSTVVRATDVHPYFSTKARALETQIAKLDALLIPELGSIAPVLGVSDLRLWAFDENTSPILNQILTSIPTLRRLNDRVNFAQVMGSFFRQQKPVSGIINLMLTSALTEKGQSGDSATDPRFRFNAIYRHLPAADNTLAAALRDFVVEEADLRRTGNVATYKMHRHLQFLADITYTLISLGIVNSRSLLINLSRLHQLGGDQVRTNSMIWILAQVCSISRMKKTFHVRTISSSIPEEHQDAPGVYVVDSLAEDAAGQLDDDFELIKASVLGSILANTGIVAKVAGGANDPGVGLIYGERLQQAASYYQSAEQWFNESKDTIGKDFLNGTLDEANFVKLAAYSHAAPKNVSTSITSVLVQPKNPATAPKVELREGVLANGYKTIGPADAATGAMLLNRIDYLSIPCRLLIFNELTNAMQKGHLLPNANKDDRSTACPYAFLTISRIMHALPNAVCQVLTAAHDKRGSSSVRNIFADFLNTLSQNLASAVNTKNEVLKTTLIQSATAYLESLAVLEIPELERHECLQKVLNSAMNLQTKVDWMHAKIKIATSVCHMLSSASPQGLPSPEILTLNPSQFSMSRTLIMYAVMKVLALEEQLPGDLPEQSVSIHSLELIRQVYLKIEDGISQKTRQHMPREMIELLNELDSQSESGPQTVKDVNIDMFAAEINDDENNPNNILLMGDDGDPTVTQKLVKHYEEDSRKSYFLCVVFVIMRQAAQATDFSIKDAIVHEVLASFSLETYGTNIASLITFVLKDVLRTNNQGDLDIAATILSDLVWKHKIIPFHLMLFHLLSGNRESNDRYLAFRFVDILCGDESTFRALYKVWLDTMAGGKTATGTPTPGADVYWMFANNQVLSELEDTEQTKQEHRVIRYFASDIHDCLPILDYGVMRCIEEEDATTLDLILSNYDGLWRYHANGVRSLRAIITLYRNSSILSGQKTDGEGKSEEAVEGARKPYSLLKLLDKELLSAPMQKLISGDLEESAAHEAIIEEAITSLGKFFTPLVDGQPDTSYGVPTSELHYLDQTLGLCLCEIMASTPTTVLENEAEAEERAVSLLIHKAFSHPTETAEALQACAILLRSLPRTWRNRLWTQLQDFLLCRGLYTESGPQMGFDGSHISIEATAILTPWAQAWRTNLVTDTAQWLFFTQAYLFTCLKEELSSINGLLQSLLEVDISVDHILFLCRMIGPCLVSMGGGESAEILIVSLLRLLCQGRIHHLSSQNAPGRLTHSTATVVNFLYYMKFRLLSGAGVIRLEEIANIVQALPRDHVLWGHLKHFPSESARPQAATAMEEVMTLFKDNTRASVL